LFPSFFLGGFECSTHRLADGRRLDVIAATRHDRFAAADYARLGEAGLLAARDGVRWHLVEPEPGRFDFASVRPLARAARAAGVTVVWDLLHYGWPDDLDPFAPQFVERFARYAGAVAAVLREEGGSTVWVCPMNEPSYLAWAGGEVGHMNPFARGRGDELKRQLVRAALAAADAVRAVDPAARFLHCDPIFHTVPKSDDPADVREAAAYRESLFQCWDMLAGRLHPELGGHPRHLDVVGVNYYPWNQWVHVGVEASGPVIPRTDPRSVPFRELLAEVGGRYGRPVLVAETGCEGDERADWLRSVGDECRAAMAAGTPVAGVCWYPVVNHPGWADDRHCHNGLWDYPDERGGRAVYEPLAAELRRQQAALDAR
jgi:beta-glucosidase/6-phospho-beta-glucosidase/beta-galactosidase